MFKFVQHVAATIVALKIVVKNRRYVHVTSPLRVIYTGQFLTTIFNANKFAQKVDTC